MKRGSTVVAINVVNDYRDVKTKNITISELKLLAKCWFFMPIVTFWKTCAWNCNSDNILVIFHFLNFTRFTLSNDGKQDLRDVKDCQFFYVCHPI